jgi:glycosyltransferase involved in cell wall biosynthesis
MKIATRLGMVDYINISHKPMKEREKYLFLSNLDILVFPSLKEGFGLPIIESVAVNTPCIIFSWSKIPPEVKKLCITAKDIEELLYLLHEFVSNKEFREDVLAKIRKMKFNLRSYSWLTYIKKLVSVYDTIIV